ncbi:hypothetical protein [Actinobacillus minor]|nr:hypothetical protein [Actinobacillus minor]MDY5107035.1 hypothetical protein [Actinobacillus minor]
MQIIIDWLWVNKTMARPKGFEPLLYALEEVYTVGGLIEKYCNCYPPILYQATARVK